MLMDGAQDMEPPTTHAMGDDDPFAQLMSACKIFEGDPSFAYSGRMDGSAVCMLCLVLGAV